MQMFIALGSVLYYSCTQNKPGQYYSMRLFTVAWIYRFHLKDTYWD